MTVSSATTLGEVKLRLIEVLGLHPSNAALYVRGSLVEGDDRTLGGACLPLIERTSLRQGSKSTVARGG